MPERELGRLRLLAAASELLTAAADVDLILRDLAGLFVPALAEWAVVDVITGPESVARKAVIHRDPSLTPPGRYERDLPPLTVGSKSSLVRALTSSEPVVVDPVDPSEVPDSEIDREQLALFERLGATRALVVPLVARVGTLGAFTLARTGPAPFTGEEIALVEGVARRSALALDNARLYDHQMNTSVAFQRSLLPSLPQPNGLRLAARYVPAREGSAIGGDWYDAFVGPDGQTTVVIGDVMGHDPHSSARMAEMRNLLRGCAWHAPGSAAVVLERLNEAVSGLSLPVIASVLCGRLEAVGSGHRLQWATAGHLPPLVVSPGRGARHLSGDHGILTGVNRTGEVPENADELEPGSRLLLYTDGLIEHRGDLQRGQESLATAAGELGGLPLEEFCDALIDRFSGPSDDDIALLAVQLPPDPAG